MNRYRTVHIVQRVVDCDVSWILLVHSNTSHIRVNRESLTVRSDCPVYSCRLKRGCICIDIIFYRGYLDGRNRRTADIREIHGRLVVDGLLRMVHHQVLVRDEFSRDDALSATGCVLVHPRDYLVVTFRDYHKAFLVRASERLNIHESSVAFVTLKVQGGNIGAQLVLFPLVTRLSLDTPGNTEHHGGRIVAEVAPCAGVGVERNV